MFQRQRVLNSGKQRRPAVGELHVGAALVQPQPPQRDCMLDAGAEVLPSAACRQKRRVDLLDEDAAVLHSLNVVRYLDQLVRGLVGIGEGTTGGKPNDQSPTSQVFWLP